jgi:hypothetical protein
MAILPQKRYLPISEVHLNEHSAQIQFVAIAEEPFPIGDQLAAIKMRTIGAVQVRDINENPLSSNAQMHAGDAPIFGSKGAQVDVGLVRVGGRVGAANRDNICNRERDRLAVDLEDNRLLFGHRHFASGVGPQGCYVLHAPNAGDPPCITKDETTLLASEFTNSVCGAAIEAPQCRLVRVTLLFSVNVL